MGILMTYLLTLLIVFGAYFTICYGLYLRKLFRQRKNSLAESFEEASKKDL